MHFVKRLWDAMNAELILFDDAIDAIITILNKTGKKIWNKAWIKLELKNEKSQE